MLIFAVGGVFFTFAALLMMLMMFGDAGRHEQHAGDGSECQNHYRRQIVLRAKVAQANAFPQPAQQIGISPIKQDTRDGGSQGQPGLPHQEKDRHIEGGTALHRFRGMQRANRMQGRRCRRWRLPVAQTSASSGV